MMMIHVGFTETSIIEMSAGFMCILFHDDV